MFFWRSFARLQGRKMAHCQFTKVHQWNPPDRFLRFLSLNKPFSVISDLRKTGKIAGVLEPRNNLPMTRWRNCSTAASSDDQRAKIPHNYRGRPRTRESMPANANNSVLAKIHERVEYIEPNRSWLQSLPATKNCQWFGTIGDSEDESDATIFSVSDSETGQQSAPRIQLELT